LKTPIISYWGFESLISQQVKVASRLPTGGAYAMNWLRRLLGRSEPSPPVDFAAPLKESRENLENPTFIHQTNWRLGRHERWNLDAQTRNF
jgi:hypothetical protein